MRTVLVIDAGHGGNDWGAQRHGLREKDVTLDIARRVYRYVTDHAPSVTPVMVRHSDTFISLPNRVAWEQFTTKGASNRAFVSVHVNSTKTAHTSARGFAAFYHYRSRTGPTLAAFIHDAIRDAAPDVPAYNAGVIADRPFGKPLYVLRATHSPACLVECLFVSNLLDNAMLTRWAVLDQFAIGIANGALAFLESVRG